MKKEHIMIFFGLILSSIPLAADTDAVLDKIYSQDQAPLLESAWLIYAAAGILEEDSDPSDALPFLEKLGWENDRVLTKGKLSLLLMENYDIPSGLMFRMTKWEHYALKDLIYLNILGGRADTRAPASGFDVVNSLSAVLEEI